ncbi:MAG TPA: NUDIX hydrolase, partial [Nocardioidaceae bacterium]|nr:NUDIX hydrolase [Nocardioidaceae bacterium]
THVLTSSSRRCWRTVAPYVDVAGLEMEDTDDLSEEDATPETVAEQVETLLGLREASVICTHRPVLPWVFGALGLEPQQLAPGSVFVAHHRRGKIVATEHHDVSFR